MAENVEKADPSPENSELSTDENEELSLPSEVREVVSELRSISIQGMLPKNVGLMSKITEEHISSIIMIRGKERELRNANSSINPQLLLQMFSGNLGISANLYSIPRWQRHTGFY
ncbi:MAG: hypothetical protein F6K30_12925 [Cyanothece sp. SIO2G6]|nr:hypothetical protein [Cyanothece sp. SIO2G6]